MKTKYILGVILMLTGCGGDQFATARALEAPDAGEADSLAMPGTGGASSTGGKTGTGGAPVATGGAATGGAPEVDAGSGGSSQATGGSSQETGGSFQGTGGTSQTGGAPGAGGAPVTGGSPGTGGVADAGCATVTHENGLGQTWQDCVPLGTYNLEQATKACEASGAASCTKSTGCGGNNETVYGLTLGSLFAHWGYGSVNAGYVNDTSVCPHDGDTRWN